MALFAFITLGIQSLAVMPGAALTVTVVGPDGAAAAGVSIWAMPLDRYGGHRREAGQTDAQGTLRLAFQPEGDETGTHEAPANLPYGLYRFVVMPEGHAWAISDFYLWNPAQPGPDGPKRFGNFPGPEWYASRRARLNEQDPPSNWTSGAFHEVHPGDALNWTVTLDPGFDAVVRVVDETGAAVPEARLVAELDLGRLSHTGAGGELEVGTFTADAEGRFTVPHAVEAVYSFLFETAPMYAPDRPYLTWERAVALAPGETVLAFKRYAALTIAVRDAATGAPVADAHVRGVFRLPFGPPDGPLGTTGADGQLAWTRYPPEHTVAIVVEKDGYPPARIEPLNPRADGVLTVSLSRGGE